MKNRPFSRRSLAFRCAAVFAAVLFVVSLAGCAAFTGETKRLENNVARIYEHDARTSHFMLNASPVGDEVMGMAMMSTSADGRTSLAWVGTNLYFVSEKGTDKLANGIDTAEISFDGQIAVWLENEQIKKYDLADRSVTVLAEGVETFVQASISPHSKTMLLTVIYNGSDDYVTLIADEDGVREFSRTMICFAISDDADIIYYYDSETKGFTVSRGGEQHIISKSCSTATNYNFTNDLSEVIYSDAGGNNHLFCLDTKNDTVIGSGFGVTEKTDIFSISTISFFTYINDIDSFRSGLWSVRRSIEDAGYLYDIGYIDAKGEVYWIAKDAVKFYTVPDQSRVYWLNLSSELMTAKAAKNAKAKKLAGSVVSFDSLRDGSRIYYLTASGSLYTLKGTGKAESVKSGVTRIAAMGNVCAFITTDGALHYADGAEAKDVSGIAGAYRFDKRAAALILYTNEHQSADGTTVYDVYMTSDGVNYTHAYDGVEP